MTYFRKWDLVSAAITFFMLFAGLLQAQDDQDFRTFKKHDGPVKAIAISIDGKTLATGGEDKFLYLWDLKSGELTGTIRTTGTVKMICFTADGNLLAACGDEIKFMDLQGHIIRTFGGYTTDIWSFSYNKPTMRITAGSYAKSVKVWDFNTGKPVLLLEGHEKSCLPVCFNPAGNIIATGSLDKSIRLWNASTGMVIRKLDIHSENIFAIDFHPSGKYFVSASADKTIRLWNADSGKVIRTFTGHKGAIFDVQFSPDGNYILSCDADKSIILWETATGRKVNTFTGHTGFINSVRFSPDGNGFASASEDQTARYWKLDKKIFLAGSYFEKEIEEAISASALFNPRRDNESKPDYTAREAEADKYLESLYDQYFLKYMEMLKKLPVE